MGRSLDSAPLLEDVIVALMIIFGMLWKPELIPVLAAAAVGLMILRRVVSLFLGILVQHVDSNHPRHDCMGAAVLHASYSAPAAASLLTVFVQPDRTTPAVSPHR